MAKTVNNPKEKMRMNIELAESTDGMGNLKPVKANSSASCKVDNVQMLLSALILHDAADGSITPT